MKKAVFISILLWLFTANVGLAFASSPGSLALPKNNFFEYNQALQPKTNSQVKTTKTPAAPAKPLINLSLPRQFGDIQSFVLNPLDVWIVVGAVLAFIYIVLAVGLKLFYKNLTVLRKLNIYLLVVILGLMTWVVERAYLMPMVKQCNYYFFCNNFPAVLALEIFYFLVFFYMLFGSRDQGIKHSKQVPIAHAYQPKKKKGSRKSNEKKMQPS